VSAGFTEIIAIGNELLIGDVQDTNTTWLCKRITGLGGFVARATLIRDEPATIGELLLATLRRGAAAIFTTGGLGPTADDLTLPAIAAALGRPLVELPAARDMVQATYTRLARAGYVAHDRLTDERRKMAVLPAGAEPLFNPVGAAPGVVLRESGAAIICLPGVPEELQGIFEQSLGPLLRELYGEGFYDERIIQVQSGDESALAPVVNRLAAGHPQVYVKSRAKAYGPDVRLRITLSARGDGRAAVEALLERAAGDLQRELAAIGIAVM